MLNGYFSDEDRPDRIGVVFYEEATPDGEPLVTACESLPGSVADSPRAKEIIRRILLLGIPVAVRNEKYVVKTYPDGRTATYLVDENDLLRTRVIVQST